MNQVLTVIYEVTATRPEFFLGFYPVVRMKEEGRLRGIEVEVILASVVQQDHETWFARRPPGVVLFRGDVADRVRREAEGRGWRCINSASAVRTARDKVATYQLAQRLGIPYPRLYQTGTPDAIALEPARFPAITKPRFGRRGRGVSLVASQQEFDALATASPNDPLLLQQDIATSHGRDLRLFIVRGKVVAAYRRRSKGRLTSNWGPESELEPPGDLSKVEPMALGLFQASGLFYGSVDFLFGENEELLLCEINDHPGFEGPERRWGTNLVGPLLDAIFPIDGREAP